MVTPTMAFPVLLWASRLGLESEFSLPSFAVFFFPSFSRLAPSSFDGASLQSGKTHDHNRNAYQGAAPLTAVCAWDWCLGVLRFPKVRARRSVLVVGPTQHALGSRQSPDLAAGGQCARCTNIHGEIIVAGLRARRLARRGVRASRHECHLASDGRF